MRCSLLVLFLALALSAEGKPPSTCGGTDDYAKALCAYQRRQFPEAELGFRSIVEKERDRSQTIRPSIFWPDGDEARPVRRSGPFVRTNLRHGSGVLCQFGTAISSLGVQEGSGEGVAPGNRWPNKSNFELRRKLLQLEALYDVGRALNTLRPEGELIEELMHRAIAAGSGRELRDRHRHLVRAVVGASHLALIGGSSMNGVGRRRNLDCRM